MRPRKFASRQPGNQLLRQVLVLFAYRRYFIGTGSIRSILWLEQWNLVIPNNIRHPG
jgi:hypothetical protein